MKKILIILLIFKVLNLNSQPVLKDSTTMNRFKFEAGFVVPIGNLKEKIGVSQIYNFSYSIKIEKNDILDIGISVIVPKVENAFNFTENDSVYSVKNKAVNVMFGCKIHKQYFINKNTSFEWISGLGVSIFSFEDKINPQDDSGYYIDENGERKYRIDTNTKGLTAMYIAQGVGFNYNNVGVECMYNFAPYYWFQKKIDPDFGNSSLCLNLYFRIP